MSSSLRQLKSEASERDGGPRGALLRGGPLDGGGDGLVPDGRAPRPAQTRAWGPFLTGRAGASPWPWAVFWEPCLFTVRTSLDPSCQVRPSLAPSRVRGGQAVHGLFTPERQPVLCCVGQAGVCGRTECPLSGERESCSVTSDSL